MDEFNEWHGVAQKASRGEPIDEEELSRYFDWLERLEEANREERRIVRAALQKMDCGVLLDAVENPCEMDLNRVLKPLKFHLLEAAGRAKITVRHSDVLKALEESMNLPGEMTRMAVRMIADSVLDNEAGWPDGPILAVTLDTKRYVEVLGGSERGLILMISPEGEPEVIRATSTDIFVTVDIGGEPCF